MIQLNRFDTKLLNKDFLDAKPFNYIIIDNFVDTEYIKKVELDLRRLEEENWYDRTSDYKHINAETDSIVQSKKVALNIRNQIPESANKVIDFFQGESFKKFLEEITGIKDVQEDPTMLGGGIHRTTQGGRLEIHADFNIHPATGKHRRINALLYLNSDWKPEHKGELELWSKDMMKCEKKIEPISNRLVIFRITDDAFHGHPIHWNSLTPRLSFAFYYYTNDRPQEEKAPFHWALWQKGT